MEVTMKKRRNRLLSLICILSFALGMWVPQQTFAAVSTTFQSVNDANGYYHFKNSQNEHFFYAIDLKKGATQYDYSKNQLTVVENYKLLPQTPLLSKDKKIIDVKLDTYWYHSQLTLKKDSKGLLQVAVGNGKKTAVFHSAKKFNSLKALDTYAKDLTKKTTSLKSVQRVPDPDKNTHPIVTIEMISGQKIKIELYPKIAPNSVNNFIALIQSHFYDGLTFHRIIENFMIQGGCPKGTGTGGPGYTIPGEFDENGFTNSLSHTRGVLSMARAQDPNSAGSQFFIVHKDATFLDGKYAAFGKVIEGLEIVDQLAAVETDSSDKPTEIQQIKSMTVDTKGLPYLQPVKQE